MRRRAATGRIMKKEKKSRPVADPFQVFNHALRFLAIDQAIRNIFGGDKNWGATTAPPTIDLAGAGVVTKYAKYE